MEKPTNKPITAYTSKPTQTKYKRTKSIAALFATAFTILSPEKTHAIKPSDWTYPVNFSFTNNTFTVTDQTKRSTEFKISDLLEYSKICEDSPYDHVLVQGLTKGKEINWGWLDNYATTSYPNYTSECIRPPHMNGLEPGDSHKYFSNWKVNDPGTRLKENEFDEIMANVYDGCKGSDWNLRLLIYKASQPGVQKGGLVLVFPDEVDEYRYEKFLEWKNSTEKAKEACHLFPPDEDDPKQQTTTPKPETAKTSSQTTNNSLAPTLLAISTALTMAMLLAYVLDRFNTDL